MTMVSTSRLNVSKLSIIICSLTILVFITLIHHTRQSLFNIHDVHEPHRQIYTEEDRNVSYTGATRDILNRVLGPSGKKRKISARGALLTPQANAVLKHWPEGKVSLTMYFKSNTALPMICLRD